VLTKLPGERLELDSAHGREVVGVPLFQDLAVVPLLILIPSFSESAERLATMIGVARPKAVFVLSRVLFFGQRPAAGRLTAGRQ
jgi:CPA2 family monovalent cation:H+ antiporter-2